MKNPEKCISVEEARLLQNNWKESRGKFIEKGQGYVDTRDFWYSLDELQEYLDYVKETSREQGVNNPGVRIYLSAYPPTPKKKSFTTIFLAPTKENSEKEQDEKNENNYEILPLNTATGGWPPKDY